MYVKISLKTKPKLQILTNLALRTAPPRSAHENWLPQYKPQENTSLDYGKT